MNLVLLLFAIVFGSFAIFILPFRYKFFATIFLTITSIAIFSTVSINVLISNNVWETTFFSNFGAIAPILFIDSLSAFFILIICFTWLTGLIYSISYLKSVFKLKTQIQISLHLFCYFWLGISMLALTSAQDFISFLIIWELMTLSSFVLVIFDAEHRIVLKSGVNYLIQMHIGLFILIVAMLIPNVEQGISSFSSLKLYFSEHSNLLLFMLFFIGFGLKSGFVPFHSWLPKTYSAAPAHISGIMSGVMSKIGIYGILRIIISVQNDLYIIGITIIVFSLFSGLWGVMQSIIQRDLKKMIAYSSIENIGIIGLGIGLGVIGVASQNNTLALLGFGGGILHILNHSLFKSLLFFSAGAIYKATNTLNIDSLGGLIKKMPKTAFAFIIGSIAICGLPPLNGFISEYLIYVSIFGSLAQSSFYDSIILIISMASLAVIGGLAIFAFSKTFGVVFLGTSRSDNTNLAKDPNKAMTISFYIIIFFIIAIGFGAMFLIKPLFNNIAQWFNITSFEVINSQYINNLQKISVLCGIFVFIVISIIFWRKQHLKNKPVDINTTWGCGYTSISSKIQYTNASFVENFSELAQPLIQTSRQTTNIDEANLFPKDISFSTETHDNIQEKLIDKPSAKLVSLLQKMAKMQTGRIEHYILYAFAFIILIFILTYFNLL